MEGNQMKMREALENIAGYAETARCHTEDAHVLGYLEQIEKWAKAALSAPPRQCDVGTPEEQSMRFHSYCLNNSSACDDGMECCMCPLEKVRARCEFAWAQTPYKAQEGATA